MYIRIGSKEISVWQLMFYVSWTVLSIWLILKVAGVIKTLIWLEYGVPVASLIIGIFGLYHNLMDNIKKLSVGFATLNMKFEHLDNDVEGIRSDMSVLKQHVSELKQDTSVLKTDMEYVKKKIN